MEQLDLPIDLGMTTEGARVGRAARMAERVLLKWITANDAGVTGSHQAGFHLPMNAGALFFSRPGLKGENMKQVVTLDWSGHRPTESVATWYGVGTRSEYRLTRFGQAFPFRGEEHVGSLLVVHPVDDDEHVYAAHVLGTDDDIEDFFGVTGLTPGDVVGLTEWEAAGDECVAEAARSVAAGMVGWPATQEMSAFARDIARDCLGVTAADGDRALSTWTDVEYQLFRTFEDHEYERVLRDRSAVDSVDDLISLALPFVNRRKSRAGRSLEHHFGALLAGYGLDFTAQVRTEGSNTMDFVLPSGQAYEDPTFDAGRLIAVGAKTSAKERWRQILDEADRAAHKFLLTLQPISAATLEQMELRGLRVVVPQALQRQFDRPARSRLMNVRQFVDFAKATTGQG